MDREDLLIVSRMVRPVYAYSFFFVTHRLLDYTIIFEYEDPLEYYRKVIEDPDLYEEELEKLRINMQNILDDEVTRFNDKEIHPKVVFVDIGFREDFKRPYIVFRISADIELRKGRNVYENIYEATYAEYDYSSYWYLPKGSRIIEVIIDGTWEIEGENLIIYVKKNTRIRGYEKITFII